MITFIAVSHFGSGDIPAYLESLQLQNESGWRLAVVDNSQSDDEFDRLMASLDGEPRASVLRAPSNLGYFGAARFALRELNPQQDKWVIVSNTDVRLGADTFVSELSGIRADAGVIAPSVVSSRDGRDQNPHLVRRPSKSAMAKRRIVLGNPVTAQLAIFASVCRRKLFPRVEKISGAREIYAAHGSFLILSEAFFRNGGTLEHPPFLFAEEITIAEQCLRLGLNTRYLPELRVEHVEHGQMGLLRSFRLLRYGAEGARYAHALIAKKR